MTKDHYEKVDVLIVGAGAAGLMCAIEAGRRHRKVVVLDQSNKPGKKILMSGGGRCNFTNYNILTENYISHNPHFCKSALKRYTQWDFIDLVKKHRIPFHEKTLGQLFCDNKASDILTMLLKECEEVGVKIYLNAAITHYDYDSPQHIKLTSTRGNFHCQSLVVASGGLSIPTMGASAFGYKVAEKFNIPLWPTRAGLVPLTLQPYDKDKFSALSGIGLDALVSCNGMHFRENILFTHRGLSGPAVLQISSYWQPGDAIAFNLLPEIDLLQELKKSQRLCPTKQINNFIAEYLPKRVVDCFLESEFAQKKLADCSYQIFEKIAENFNGWQLKPNGTEGYRTAEVTLGGVDCSAISSKTMEAIDFPGLYFIGEVIDVTGWLGGYNFQWAWSSGWAAGQVV